MKKIWKRCLLFAAGYIILLLVLLMAERSAADSGIRTWGDAVWYSLVTLTTVGYGDLYPVSDFGRVVGLAFVFCSLGLMAAVLSMLVSILTGNMLPKLRLWRGRKKHWYLIEGKNDGAISLGKALAQDAKALVVFCGSEAEVPSCLSVPFSIEQILKDRQAEVDVFLLDEDGDENYHRALQLAELQTSVYCRTEMGEDSLPERVTRFCPEDTAARVYWQKHSVGQDRCIVLVGGGKLLHALLERAILTNIVDHPVEYHVYGEDGSFLRYHYCLGEVLSLGKTSENRDSLIFEKEPLGSDPSLLYRADRVILCEDGDNFRNYRILHEHYPMQGKIHFYGSMPGVICFGQELYTPENVMGTELTRLAREMNEIYRNSVSYPAPSWEELTPFYRRSNVASADHLLVKAQLLGYAGDPRGAYRAYLARTPDEQLKLWEIEHIRWMRFYALSNWQYGPDKSAAERRHPLMIPFEQLPYEEQAKDADAWLLLGKVNENYTRV